MVDPLERSVVQFYLWATKEYTHSNTMPVTPMLSLPELTLKPLPKSPWIRHWMRVTLYVLGIFNAGTQKSWWNDHENISQEKIFYARFQWIKYDMSVVYSLCLLRRLQQVLVKSRIFLYINSRYLPNVSILALTTYTTIPDLTLIVGEVYNKF